ncbi:MAG: DUF2597 family protein [Cellvibrionaceae bacterium]
MSGKRISGSQARFTLGDYLLKTIDFTLNIEDSSGAVYLNSRPDGWVNGDVKASGEMTVTSSVLSHIIDIAESAGSFQDLEPFDLVCNAETNSEKLNIEAFGCKLKISDLLNAQSNSNERIIHKIPYEVTDEDFININGVPYLAPVED